MAKYETTIDNVKDTLVKYGVAVIPDILSTKQIKQMKSNMWKMLNELTINMDNPITKNNESSWRSFYDLMPLHSMLVQHWGVGHSELVWAIRQNKNVCEVFEKIWDTDKNDLLVSFDGVSIHFPPEITGRGWYRKNDWLHVDQSYNRNDFECVQGFVSGFDINEGDATFTFLEKSHLYHKDFKKKFSKKDFKGDWYRLESDKEYDFYLKKGCKRANMTCSAGSIVLWDSRLVHCGKEAERNREEQNMRLVVYVCMTPREYSTESQLRKKRDAFNNKRMTTHNPHKIKLFSLMPRSYGKELPNVGKLSEPNISDLGRRLAGF